MKRYLEGLVEFLRDILRELVIQLSPELLAVTALLLFAAFKASEVLVKTASFGERLGMVAMAGGLALLVAGWWLGRRKKAE